MRSGSTPSRRRVPKARCLTIWSPKPLPTQTIRQGSGSKDTITGRIVFIEFRAVCQPVYRRPKYVRRAGPTKAFSKRRSTVSTAGIIRRATGDKSKPIIAFGAMTCAAARTASGTRPASLVSEDKKEKKEKNVKGGQAPFAFGVNWCFIGE